MRHTSLVCAISLLANAVVHAQVQFGPMHAAYPSTLRSFGAVAAQGDLNNDGKIDLVFNGSGAVPFALGTGAGSWGTIHPLFNPDSAFTDISLVVDLDMDGDQDILTTSHLTPELFFHQNTGNGEFADAALIPLNGLPNGYVWNWLRVVDLDQDGDQDLVGLIQYPIGLNTNYRIAWVEQADVNNWADAVTFPSFEVSGGTDLFDIDNDGDQDVVFGIGSYNDQTGSIKLLRNNGSGAFSEEYVVPITNSFIPRNSLKVADLDLDGDQDMFIIGWNGISQTGLYVIENDGASWAAPVMVPLSSNLDHDPVYGDIDSDGDLDLIERTLDGDSIVWLRNNGIGNAMTSMPTVPSNMVSDGNALNKLTLIDADNDSDLDLLYPFHGLSLSLDQGNGVFGPGFPVLWPVGPTIDIVSVTDFDLDGREDVIESTSCRSLAWSRSESNGVFSAPTWVAWTSAYVYPDQVFVHDLNNDAYPDIVFFENESRQIIVVRNEAASSFSSYSIAMPVGTNEILRLFQVADLDADGDLDVVYAGDTDTSVQCLINDGNGNFSGPLDTQAPFVWPPGIPYVEDMNDDHAADLLTMRPDDQGVDRLVYWRNNGTGSFTVVDTIAVAAGIGGIFDLDEDGDEDVLFVDTWSGTRFDWVRNDQGQWSGKMMLFQNTSGPSAESVLDIDLFDLDGDGDKELFYTDYLALGPTRTKFLPSLGGGVFGDPVIVCDTCDRLTTISVCQALDSIAPFDLMCVYPTYSLGENIPSWIGNFSGSQYQMRGFVFRDLNGNGVRDPNDPPMPWALASAQPVAAGAMTYPNGEYVIVANAGTFNVNVHNSLPDWLWNVTTQGGPQYNVTLTENDPVRADLDFGFAPAFDTSIVIPHLEAGYSMCNAGMPLWLNYANQGTRVEHGVVSLRLDTLLTYSWADPQPDSIVDHTAWWHMDTLNYGQMRTLMVQVVSPSAEHIGDTVNVEMVVHPASQFGQQVAPTSATLSWPVACAYDPNDIHVSPKGYGSQGAVDLSTSSLDYTIRFQNVGNAPAYSVEIQDQLPAELDPSSIQLLGSSRPPSIISVSPTGRLSIRFQGIMLPDSASDPGGSQGYVAFRIRIMDGLPDMTTFTNSASIYFDLNPAVITNTVTTTLVDCVQFDPTITWAGTNVIQTVAADHYQWYLNGTALPGDTSQTALVAAIGDYTVHAISTFGCEATSEPYTVTALGVASTEEQHMAIVPNPAHLQATLVSDAVLGPNDRITLVDMLSTVHFSCSGSGSTRIQLPLQGLAPGEYSIEIRRQNGTRSFMRFVVL